MTKAFWLSSLLVGILAAFFVWALTWSVTDESESHFGLSDEATSMTFAYDGSSDAPQGQGSQVLEDFLRSHSLTLLVVAGGDGAPQVAAYNPGDRVPWLSGAPVTASSTPVYLFEGTYSFDRWTQERSRPLVPSSLEIAGAVPRPPGVDRQQYVVVDPPGRAPSGTFVLSTSAKGEVDQFVALVSAEGLSMQGSTTRPLSVLLRDPLVVLSLLMLTTGSAGMVAYWVNVFGRQALETEIRRQSGGSVLVVATTYLRRYVVAPVVGVPIGCLMSLAVVRAAAGQWSDSAEVGSITLAAVTGAVVVCVALFAVLLVVVRRQVRAE